MSSALDSDQSQHTEWRSSCQSSSINFIFVLIIILGLVIFFPLFCIHFLFLTPSLSRKLAGSLGKENNTGSIEEHQLYKNVLYVYKNKCCQLEFISTFHFLGS